MGTSKGTPDYGKPPIFRILQFGLWAEGELGLRGFDTNTTTNTNTNMHINTTTNAIILILRLIVYWGLYGPPI